MIARLLILADFIFREPVENLSNYFSYVTKREHVSLNINFFRIIIHMYEKDFVNIRCKFITINLMISIHEKIIIHEKKEQKIEINF